MGLNMIVGFRYDILVYPDTWARRGKPKYLRGYISGTDLTRLGKAMNETLSSDGSLVPRMKHTVDIGLDVFEADLPPGQMRRPEEYKSFKVLFSDSLTGTVTPAAATSIPAPAD